MSSKYMSLYPHIASQGLRDAQCLCLCSHLFRWIGKLGSGNFNWLPDFVTRYYLIEAMAEISWGKANLQLLEYHLSVVILSMQYMFKSPQIIPDMTSSSDTRIEDIEMLLYIMSSNLFDMLLSEQIWHPFSQSEMNLLAFLSSCYGSMCQKHINSSG